MPMKRTTQKPTDSADELDAGPPADAEPAPDAAPPPAAGAQTAPETDAAGELKARAEALEDSLFRARADYQNLQRRSATERAEAVRFANAELLRSLVGVLDGFERSLAAASDAASLPAVVEGVRLVYQNLLQALQTHGLERIEALHRRFDPTLHDALMQQPCADHPSGTVIEEVAKGYRLRDRVLRPSKVIVSQAVEATEAREGREGGAEGGEASDGGEPNGDGKA